MRVRIKAAQVRKDGDDSAGREQSVSIKHGRGAPERLDSGNEVDGFGEEKATISQLAWMKGWEAQRFR